MESRTIKSFKLRGTRITAAQGAARERLWERFGIDLSERPLDLPALFPMAKRIAIEIGFGMGEATIEMAEQSPEIGILAIDVHQPGIGKLLASIEETRISNVRVMDADAHLVLQQMIADGGVDAVHLFFPDPWPKTRHHKRRIVNPEFIELLAQKIKSDGELCIATDWQPYAQWIEEQFGKVREFSGGKIERPVWRPLTRFEGQGLRKNHVVTDFLYKRS
jgi:tRNA (guanine-N7-)-methyltransferase